MNDDLNRVELRGRVNREPVLRYTPNGKAVANLGLATTTGPNPVWFNLVAWEKLGKQLMAEGLEKGDRLHVRGRFQSRSWEGQDGQKHHTTEVVVEEIISTKGRTATPALDEEVSFR